MKKSMFLLLSIFLACQAFAAPTAVTPVNISETSSEPTQTDVDAVNGNSVINTDGDVMLWIENGSGTLSLTATLAAQTTSLVIPGYGTVTKSDITCTLAIGESCFIGPVSKTFYNDGNGRLQLTFTGAGSANADLIAFKAQRP